MNYLSLDCNIFAIPTVACAAHDIIGIWIRVLNYCVRVENGGRIGNGARWSNDIWLKTCGVSAKDVTRAAPLLAVAGDDVEVLYFPMAAQKKVQAGRAGGESGGRPKRSGENGDADNNPAGNPPRKPPGNPAGNPPRKPPGNPAGNPKKRKEGKESKVGRARPPARASGGSGFVAPSAEEVWLMVGAEGLGLTRPMADYWHNRMTSRGWLRSSSHGPEAIRDWKALLRADVGWITKDFADVEVRDQSGTGKKNGAPRGPNDFAPPPDEPGPRFPEPAWDWRALSERTWSTVLPSWGAYDEDQQERMIAIHNKKRQPTTTQQP